MSIVGVERDSQLSRLALDGDTNFIDIINANNGKLRFLPWFVNKGFWRILVSG